MLCAKLGTKGRGSHTQELCFCSKTSWKSFPCQIHFLLSQISKQMVEELVFDFLGNQQYKLVVIEFC